MTELLSLLTLFAAVLSEEGTASARRRVGAGVLVTDGSRVLLLLRSRGVTEPGTWGVPGGSAEPGEELLRAALREAVEEVGGLPSPGIFVGKREVGSFTTFVWLVDPSVLDAFQPRLNWEHDRAVLRTVPQALLLPLHPGLRTLLEGPVPGLGSLGAFPTRAEAARLWTSFDEHVGRELSAAEDAFGDRFDPREDFDFEECFERWASLDPRVRLLGFGTDRAAFLVPRGVLKLSYGGGGSDQCVSEAVVWREAPEGFRHRLVPVLDADPEGRWLLTERVSVLADDPSSELLEELEEAGLDCDAVPGNVTSDGRLLDYGVVDWDSWNRFVRSHQRQLTSRPPTYSDHSITAVYDYYGEPGVRELHHAFKAHSPGAVEQMCLELAPYVPSDVVLVPMPSRTGWPRATLDLVRCLAREVGCYSSTCLFGDPRPSAYHAKKRGEVPELGFRVEGPVPAGKIMIVDHVIGTGRTARAALAAFPPGRAQVLAHAIDLRSFRP